jgi:ADP-ribose pyrophosphatase
VIRKFNMPLTKTIFEGRIIRLDVERVRLPNGVDAELEIVRHPGGAATVALDGESRVCLLKQYRHVVGGWLWELPAGKLEANESPLATAQRELQEEAGTRAGAWEALGGVWSSPGIFTEVIHLFLAHDLTPVASNHDREELIEAHWVGFARSLSMIEQGEITDAKTVLGLLRAWQRQRAADPSTAPASLT